MRGMGWFCRKWENFYSMMAASYLLPVSFCDDNVWTVWASDFRFGILVGNNERNGRVLFKMGNYYSKVTAAYLLPVSFLTIMFEPYELETSNLVPSLAIVRGMGGYRQKWENSHSMMAAAYVLLLSFFDHNVWTVWARNFKFFVMNVCNNEAMSIRRRHPHFSFGIAFCCVVTINAIFQYLLS